MNKINAERTTKVEGTVITKKFRPRIKPSNERGQGMSHLVRQESLDSYIPEFRTQAEFDAWWDALPKVEPDVDPRLLEKVKTSIRFSRKAIDGFNYLAEQKGIRSGQTLMKIVLDNYLAKSLPPDF